MMNPQLEFPLRAGRPGLRACCLLVLLAAGNSGAPRSDAAQSDTPQSVGFEATRVMVGDEEVYAVGFDKLASFKYTIVDSATGASPQEIEAARKHDQIPSWLRFYEGKRVELTGFL